MSLRTISTATDSNYSIEMWASVYNELANDVGNLTLLDTSVKSSVVSAVNEIQDQIDSLIVGAFALSNNIWFEAGLFGGGDGNVFRLNVSNNIEFGRNVEVINIIGGTISGLDSPIAISEGGTGAVDVTNARTNLGLAIGTNVQAHSARLTNFSTLNPSTNSLVIGGASDWEVITEASFKTAFGLVVGTHLQAFNARLQEVSNITPSNNSFIIGNGTAFVGRDATFTRTALGLVVGTNVQAWSNRLDNISAIVTPNENSILVANSTGNWIEAIPSNARTALGLVVGTNVQAYSVHLQNIADAAKTNGNILIANGTSYVSTIPSDARTALGLAIGTNVQAYNAKLQEISSASASANNMLIGNGTNFISQTPSQIRTALGLVVGTNVQAYNARLQEISGISASANQILVGNGSAWTGLSGASARSALGLTIGTNVQAYNARLQNISGLSPTNNGVIHGNGSVFTLSSGETLRVNLGVAARGANTDITSLTSVSTVRSGATLNLGWDAANRVIASGSNFSPSSPGALNLGDPTNDWNGVRCRAIAPSGSNSIIIYDNSSIAQGVIFNFDGSGFGGPKPTENGMQWLGSSTLRFNRLYTVNAADVSSDMRLKTDIENLSPEFALETIRQLHEYRYTKSGNKEFGYFAQEVFEHIPDAVSKGDSIAVSENDVGFSPWGMRPDMLIPFLTSATKEIDKRLEKVISQIEDIYSKIGE